MTGAVGSLPFICHADVLPGGIVVVRVAGELDVAGVSELRTLLYRAAAVDRPLIVMDLAAMTFCDSSGVGVLIGVRKRVQDRGGQLVLAAPVPAVANHFGVMGLPRAFLFEDTVEAAVGVLAGSAGQDPAPHTCAAKAKPPAR